MTRQVPVCPVPSIRGWRAALPPLRSFFLKGGGAALFSPLAWLFGVSSRDAGRGLRKIPIFFQFLLEFHPACKEALMVVEHSAQHLSCLIYRIFHKTRVLIYQEMSWVFCFKIFWFFKIFKLSTLKSTDFSWFSENLLIFLLSSWQRWPTQKHA